MAVYGSLVYHTLEIPKHCAILPFLNRLFQVGQPMIGDVVFFDNSYDRNRNDRLDDLLTHIAIVVSVDEDETVHMMHLGGSGITDLVKLTHKPNTGLPMENCGTVI